MKEEAEGEEWEGQKVRNVRRPERADIFARFGFRSSRFRGEGVRNARQSAFVVVVLIVCCLLCVCVEGFGVRG